MEIHPKHFEDYNNCPVCGESYSMGCRCRIADRKCPNGHTWHVCVAHKRTVVGGDGHQAAEYLTSCTCKVGEVLPPMIKTAKVQKGDVRNTVLRQIKAVGRVIDLLNQGISVKSKEVEEFKGEAPEKVKILRKQISIMESGIGHLVEAIKMLHKYKGTSTK